MRKVKFKMMGIALATTIALMFLGIGSGQAQSAISSAFTPPGSPSSPSWTGVIFVSSSEAMDILEDHCAVLKDFLITLTPGTQAYHTAETNQFFYEGIRTGIHSGKNAGVDPRAMVLFSQPEFVDTPQFQQIDLYEESTDLLSN
ncbi:MAG: hypothetical protein IPJ00_00900 [Saprospirales bacterium]|nr:hypothetical protein [Saprospirales bacterium]